MCVCVENPKNSLRTCIPARAHWLDLTLRELGCIGFSAGPADQVRDGYGCIQVWYPGIFQWGEMITFMVMSRTAPHASPLNSRLLILCCPLGSRLPHVIDTSNEELPSGFPLQRGNPCPGNRPKVAEKGSELLDDMGEGKWERTEEDG